MQNKEIGMGKRGGNRRAAGSISDAVSSEEQWDALRVSPAM